MIVNKVSGGDDDVVDTSSVRFGSRSDPRLMDHRSLSAHPLFASRSWIDPEYAGVHIQPSQANGPRANFPSITVATAVAASEETKDEHATRLLSTASSKCNLYLIIQFLLLELMATPLHYSVLSRERLS